MKKLIMAVAAVVGLRLGFVHAEDIVDFDGKCNSPMNFTEAIKNAKAGQNDKIVCEQPKPAAVSSGNMEMPVFGLRMLTAMDESIKSAISYSTTHDNQLVKENLEQLLKTGSFEQKYEFAYGSEAIYYFPDNLAGKGVEHMSDGRIINAGNINSSKIYMENKCVKYAYDHVCLDKQVCKYTCVIVGAAAATWGSVNGVWQIIIPAAVCEKVCEDVCANVPICTDTPRCVEWAST